MSTAPDLAGPRATTPLEEVAVGFGRALRRAGVAAGPERVRMFAEALGHVDVMSRRQVYWAGRTTCCSTRQELDVYDGVFADYFASTPPGAHSRQRTEVVRPTPGGPGGEGGVPGEEDELVVGTASRTEILRHRDLATLDEDERREVATLIAALSFGTPVRPSRRRRPQHRGPLDRPRTTAHMLRAGGEPTRLHRHRAGTRPRPVVLLVDVSGSMRPYAEAYLRFAHALCRVHRRTEVFTAGTRLTRTTEALSRPSPDAALAALSREVPDWSGGTRLGEVLQQFLRGWAGRSAVRGAVAVVVSDGWERGGAELLGGQMRRLHRVAHRVVWANPHKGKAGYAPRTAGMQAALPSVDDFVAGHTLADLEDLARRLGRVTREVVDRA